MSANQPTIVDEVRNDVQVKAEKVNALISSPNDSVKMVVKATHSAGRSVGQAGRQILKGTGVVIFLAGAFVFGFFKGVSTAEQKDAA